MPQRPLPDACPELAKKGDPQRNEAVVGVPGASTESTSPVPGKDGPLWFLLRLLEFPLLLSQTVLPDRVTRTACATRARAVLRIAEGAHAVPSSGTRPLDLVPNQPSGRTSNAPDPPQGAHPATSGAALVFYAI